MTETIPQIRVRYAADSQYANEFIAYDARIEYIGGWVRIIEPHMVSVFPREKIYWIEEILVPEDVENVEETK